MGSASAVFRWRRAIRDAELSAACKLVAVMISTYMSPQADSAYPGVARLARDCSLGETTVKRSLRTLRDGGWLRVIHGGGGRGRATEYAGLIPEEKGGQSEPVSVAKPGHERPKGGQSRPGKGAMVAPQQVIEQAKEQQATLAKRDLVFEAVAEACGLDWRNDLTESARGALNKAVERLRKVGATPEEVARRAGSYRRRWPNVDLTPSALEKHWPQLAQDRSSVPRSWAAIEEATR